MSKEIEYITKSKLKERGWTDSIIRKMKIIPNLIKINPHSYILRNKILNEIGKLYPILNEECKKQIKN